MATFCSSCGTQLPEGGMFCPKCGKSKEVQSAPMAAGTGAGTAPAITPTAAPEGASAGAGVQDNIAGLLAYLIIPAIVFLFLEPYNRNKFVRFHSFQAIGLWVVCLIVNAVIGVIPIINLLLIPFAVLAEVIIGLICMVKAFQNQSFKLPVIGDFAEKQANG